MFCTQCGKKMDGDCTFCPYCGQRVSVSEETGKRSCRISEKVPRSGDRKMRRGITGIAAVFALLVLAVFGRAKWLGGSHPERTSYETIYNWKMVMVSDVDLSAYHNSADIYAAVEYNYNNSESEYFENALEQALYLADKDYNTETGEGFASEDEKRFYFMQAFHYDISTGELVDKEIVDALIAYQEYASSLPDIDPEEQVGYTLIYLNDDEVPECLVWVHTYSFSSSIYGRIYVLSCYNGTVKMYAPESAYLFQAFFSYTPGKGRFCAWNVLGLRSATDWIVAELDVDFNKIGDAWQDNDYEGNYFYFLNDSEVEKEEIDAYIDSFGFEITLETAEAKSVLSAYDAFRAADAALHFLSET